MRQTKPTRARQSGCLLAMILLWPFAQPDNLAAERTLLVDFDQSIQTERGGLFSSFGGLPAQVADSFKHLGLPATTCWRIDVTARADTDNVGALIPFGRLDAAGPSKLPPVDRIGFRMIGQLGQRQLEVDLDEVGQADAPTIGVIQTGQLDGRSWNAIELRFVERRCTPACSIRIRAVGTGPCWFAIDHVTYGLGDNAERAPISVTRREPETRSLRCALWVWDTSRILSSEAGVPKLLDFCTENQITDLFFQVPYSYVAGEVKLQLIQQQRSMNAAAHDRGIKTHALDGAPEYILPQHQARMSELVKAIRELNATAAPNEAYTAVHLDNEPYLLPGWSDVERRQRLIQHYVELNRKLRRQTAELGLTLGIDIPFWLDTTDENGETEFAYIENGKRTPLLEALFPLVDNVGVMAYRDRVTGPNGVVALCRREFELGQRCGVDVFAAVELGMGDNVESGTTFGPYGLNYFDGQLQTLRRVLAHVPAAAGVAIHYYKPYSDWKD